MSPDSDPALALPILGVMWARSPRGFWTIPELGKELDKKGWPTKTSEEVSGALIWLEFHGRVWMTANGTYGLTKDGSAVVRRALNMSHA